MLKRTLFVLTLLLSFHANGWAPDKKNLTEPLVIRTIDDKEVKVNPQRVKLALYELIGRYGKNYGERYLNEDGSVTFINPKFKYANEDCFVDCQSGPGLCYRLGFAQFRFHEQSSTNNVAMVTLDKDGNITGALRNQGKAQHIYKLTCSGFMEERKAPNSTQIKQQAQERD